MRQNVWNKKIPTLAAFVLVFLSIWITSLLVQKGVLTIGRATTDTKPEHVQMTNITDSSFTVSFTTREKTRAGVQYGETEESFLVAYDIRDTSSQSQGSFYSHYIPVTGLKAGTKYYFSIVSGGTTFLDNEKKFTVTTAASIDTEQKIQKALFGKVIFPNGLSASDTLVTLKSEGGASLSVLTKESGEFMVPLEGVRTGTLDAYNEFGDTSVIQLEMVHRDLKSFVKTTYKNAQFLPIVTLSKDYDFTVEPPLVRDASQVASSEATLTIPTPGARGRGEEVQITYPKEDQAIIDARPVFRGTTIPYGKVKVIIESSHVVEGEAIADARGNWIFRPSSALPPGEHTITVETADSFGIIRRLTQSFTVFAQGSQVIQPATPSATPTRGVTPKAGTSQSPTSAPGPSITTSPSLITSPSPTSQASASQPSPTGKSSVTLTPTGGVGAQLTTPTPSLRASLTLTPSALVATSSPTRVAIATTTPSLTPGSQTPFVFWAFFSVFLIVLGSAMVLLL